MEETGERRENHRPVTSDWQTWSVVIVWYLDLQLPVQSMSITTKGVSSNPVYGEVYSMQHYVIKFVNELRLLWNTRKAHASFKIVDCVYFCIDRNLAIIV
jgi:hypothetical protein